MLGWPTHDSTDPKPEQAQFRLAVHESGSGKLKAAVSASRVRVFEVGCLVSSGSRPAIGYNGLVSRFLGSRRGNPGDPSFFARRVGLLSSECSYNGLVNRCPRTLFESPIVACTFFDRVHRLRWSVIGGGVENAYRFRLIERKALIFATAGHLVGLGTASGPIKLV